MPPIEANNKAHKTFKKTIARSFRMVQMFEHGRVRRGRRIQIKQPDILSAAMVIAVAGMGAFFTSRAVDAASKKISSKSQLHDGFIDLLQKAGVNEIYLLSIIKNDRPIRSIRNQLDKHFSMRVTQSFEAINNI